MAKIYIASSWRHQHAVEMLTVWLRSNGHVVLSFIENNHGENPNAAANEASKDAMPFDEWCHSPSGDKSFEYDTQGAATSDLVIYIGGSGKDAAAEVGIAWASKVPVIGLYQKGEDFGLMRRLIKTWFYRWDELVDSLHQYVGRAKEVCNG